jgi:uncharacterized protein with NRDE domain
MCLIVVGWRVHPDFPLIVAANRDEFHARPTAYASRWSDAPYIIGGRDLEAGGTWLGVTDTGRFAAVTNVREPGMAKGARTRGELTAGFLRSDLDAGLFAQTIKGADYSGFNLLLADDDALYYASNRDGETRPLAPGIYGMSNHLLDTPWPKLIKARRRFAEALPALPDETAFFELLADRHIESDERLPNTGVSIEWERILSAVFVSTADYGTRASTLLLRDANGGVRLHEKSFGTHGRPLQSSVISTSV